MSFYKKKPVVIEARRFSQPEDTGELAIWCGGAWFFGSTDPANYTAQYIVIPTLEGDMRATPGDYIIKGVQGEFYPCKPDIFEQTYQPIEVPA